MKEKEVANKGEGKEANIKENEVFAVERAPLFYN